MKKLFLFVAIALIAFSALGISAYADDCTALGGSIVSGECQISSTVSKVGPYIIDETLHILSNNAINSSNTTTVGISLRINGDLILENASKISANDDAGSDSEPASPIILNISGSLEMNENSGILAENRRGGGEGGNITITTGADILMKSHSTISASRTNGGGPGGPTNAGTIRANAGGDITIEHNAVIAASNRNKGPGNIYIEAYGKINIDGLLSVGPSTEVLSTKWTGYIFDPRDDSYQQGGKISIISNSVDEPGILIGENAIIGSQGEDPSSDKILLEGCGIEVNGLIGSVAKKSHANGANGPAVILRSGSTIEINGQDLGGIGPGQARIRADYNIGEKPKPQRVDIFARGAVTIKGALSSNISTVTTNGGGSTDQFGGNITIISLEDKIKVTAKALQAKATSAGGDGGYINLSAKSDIDLDTASVEAPGDFNPTGGIGFGGKINAKSYINFVTWTFGLGDVRPTGTVISTISKRGTVNLSACTTINVAGTSFPSSGIATVPGILTGSCAPSEPGLPPGEEPLPTCRVPECGDGILDSGEACDDGNENNNDSCRNDCTTPFCGDGIKDANEECDDGNQNNDDQCRNDCTTPVCGDGIKDANEECDDGNQKDRKSTRLNSSHSAKSRMPSSA